MKLENQEFTVLPNGDVEAAQIYKQTNVVQNVDGEDIVLGVQPEYRVLNIIHKDKIKYLLKFLKQQELQIQKRIDAADEVIKKLDHINLEAVAEAIKKIPKEKLQSKKMESLNRLSEQYYMKQGAIDNKVVLIANIEKFTKQIDFFSKLI
jgi:hypothetical protein